MQVRFKEQSGGGILDFPLENGVVQSRTIAERWVVEALDRDGLLYGKHFELVERLLTGLLDVRPLRMKAADCFGTGALDLAEVGVAKKIKKGHAMLLRVVRAAQRSQRLARRMSTK